MIIRNVVGIIVLAISLLLNTINPLLFASYFMGNTFEEVNNVFNMNFDLCSFIYTHIFKTNMYYKGTYKASDKVDILIANHLIYYDFMTYISILRLYDSRPIYFITMEYLMKVPGLGILATNHILIDYKHDNFVQNCHKALKNIKEGIVVIMPEGELRRQCYINKSNEFCKNNNYPQLKNVIFPKFKGLYTIIDILNKDNKLGNLIDFTLYIDNLKPYDTFKEVFHNFAYNKIDNTIINFNTLEFKNINITNYDSFKQWFIPFWYKKDNQLTDIINTKEDIFNNLNNYSLYEYKVKSKTIIYIIIMLLILIFFINNTYGIYIPVAIASSLIFADLSYNRVKHL